jgi:hypothetical protein
MTNPDPLYDLLAAVLEALDIPHPATVGDTEEHSRVLADRAMHAVIVLRNVLGDQTAPDIAWMAAYLRKQLATVPPTSYRSWGER